MEAVVRPDQLVSFRPRADAKLKFARWPERKWLHLLKLTAAGIVSASVAAAVTLIIIPDSDAPQVERLTSFGRPLADLQPAPFQITDVAPIQAPLIDVQPPPFQVTDAAPMEWSVVDPQPLPFQTTL